MLASDPLRNVVFGWQAYWSGSFDNRADYYQKLSGMTLRQAFDAVRTAPFMIQVGVSSDQADMWPRPIDRFGILDGALARARNLNFMWWDWAYSPGQLTVPPNNYGNWDNSRFPSALRRGGIAGTSVSTYFQNHQSCR